jgi:ABC-type glutathione transport system ATPase component
MTALLEVQDLRVSYVARDGQRSTALAQVNFALQRGEILGVLGESGSGKSTLAAALLRVLPRNAEIETGSVGFEGRDLLRLESSAMREARGARLAMIF